MPNALLKHITHETDFCVVGGGMAGMCAAISAARHGTRVVLIQDRPVLGGNASSEIRMWIRGANGFQNRETGILSEIELDNIYRNSDLNFHVWDSILYEKVKNEKNITLLLNCSCADADCENGHIKSVDAWQLTTYTWHTVKAKYFADCSGDSILAPITGAKYRVGREACSEFNESIEPPVADKKTMGMSCMIQARQTNEKSTFIPPKWAYVYNTDDELQNRYHQFDDYQNFWWMEIGGEDDSIHDSEMLRDELLKIAFGIWDHVKNRGDHGADNWQLDWIGFLPGKRESRRYEGDYIMTQNDVEAGGNFSDAVAYGGWTMDDHNPEGFYHKGEQTIFHPAPSPYTIPYRSTYSVNIDNLFFAGRNISVTHAALSSTRVMATCAVIGQAVGTAAAICESKGIFPRDVYKTEIENLQNQLLDDGCFIPGISRKTPALTLEFDVNADKNTLFNGIERPTDKENYIILEKGEPLVFSSKTDVFVNSLRIVFDIEFMRRSMSKNSVYRRFAMRSNIPVDFEPVKMPETIVKAFTVTAKNSAGEVFNIYSCTDNYQGLVSIDINQKINLLEIIFDETYGADRIHIYSCDVK